MPNARRRWLRPRYSLTTLFVVVTVFGCWLGVQVKWVRERREFVSQFACLELYNDAPTRRAPGALSLFGVRAVAILVLGNGAPEDRARVLFPEAEIADPNPTPPMN